MSTKLAGQDLRPVKGDDCEPRPGTGMEARTEAVSGFVHRINELITVVAVDLWGDSGGPAEHGRYGNSGL